MNAPILVEDAISEEEYIATLASLTWPKKDFDSTLKSVALDYSDANAWASLPKMQNGAAALPQGVSLSEQQERYKPADVFYMHPTTHPLSSYHRFGPSDIDRISGESAWNLDIEDKTHKKWIDDILKKQASVFNGSCRIYAPRYRQANIMVLADLVARDGENGSQALSLAYHDLRAAFEYYLENHNDGRPFFLAGHSQGSYHGQRLIKEFISGTALHEHFIAAYLIGVPIAADYLENIPDIPVCNYPEQPGCLVGYRSWLKTKMCKSSSPSACVNPLNWKSDGYPVAREDHLGAITFSIEPGELSRPLQQVLSTQCIDGFLSVECDNPEICIEWPGQQGNLHACDYELFYMNLRDNIDVRMKAFLHLGSHLGSE